MSEPKKPATICVVNFYEDDRGGMYCYSTIFVRSSLVEVEEKLKRVHYSKSGKRWKNSPSCMRRVEVEIEEKELFSLKEFSDTIF